MNSTVGIDGEISMGAAQAAPAAVEANLRGFSVRTPNEILAMEFDPNDRYIDNGVLAKGQALTILGPGGVGKSRLLLHLAACTILGKEFLGMKVNAKGLKWLIVQTENSNYRLKIDLAALRAWVGEKDWPTVEEGLVIHTLENQDDTLLSLKNPKVVGKLEALIKCHKFDVVAFDPLVALAVGSLNNDAGMVGTCHAVTDLIRKGKPETSTVILHHTLTGKQGAAKATGVDRASYGRGSKMLHAWTRGQINVSLRGQGRNPRLLLSCGKNSNGEEFDPIGIRLDPVTLISEVDPDFDLEEWRDENDMGEAPKRKFGTDDIAIMVVQRPMTRQELTKNIIDEQNCSQAKAYNLVKDAMGKTIRQGKGKILELLDPPPGQKSDVEN